MSVLSTSTNEAAAANAITVTRPAGAGATHVLLAAVWRNTGTAADGGMTGSTGWTRILTASHSAYAASEIALFWALGDVAALTFTIPDASTADIRALVTAFADRNLSTPIGASGSAESVGATTVVPSLATAAGDDVVATWADFQANISGPITGGAPAGYTDRFDDNTPTDVHVIGATAEGVAAGSTGALSRACGNFTAKIAAGVVIQAAGGGGGGGGGGGESVNIVVF